jgi:hypothetical protein
MQDDQIGRKFMRLASDGMARLSHLINSKIILVVNDLVRQMGLHQLSTTIILLLVHRYLWFVCESS